MSTPTIVWLIIAAVAVVAAVVLCIVFRQKVAKTAHVYRSEIKKIVWFPWPQTRKNTILALIVLLICAAVICLLDLGLQKGFLSLISALSPKA